MYFCFPLQSPTGASFLLLLHDMAIQTVQTKPTFQGSSCFHSHLYSSSPSILPRRLQSLAPYPSRKSLKLNCSSNGNNDEQDYLLDAPVSVGDGFSFSGGKYSDEPSPSDEWFKQGKMVRAYSIPGTGEKAKDPIFGLTMGASSQATGDRFRWFCVESGSAVNPSVILIHGFPSQAYSYRKVLPVLSKDYHAIAFDWLGFGFSDKPQPRYGFDYTLNEYASSLESLINELAVSKVSLVVQGYFAPVVVKYASFHQEKLNNLILLNPPLTAQHAKLPPTLSIFSNFLFGEIFSQDPLRASDKALTSCGPYKMKEEDAMVYRRPYLTSGSSGFALNAISRTMKKDLKLMWTVDGGCITQLKWTVSNTPPQTGEWISIIPNLQTTLKDKNWNVRTAICWGQRDRWLSYDGVEDFCKDSNHTLIEVPMAGHHVQEDCGEELGQLIYEIISRRKQT